MNYKMYARAGIRPTEDLEKVIKALSNLFDYDDIEIGEDYVCATGESESLKNFKESLKERKIRSTARNIMLKGASDNKVFFRLSKQAALIGVPNFVEEELSPLGELEVTVRADNIEGFINWIAPEISL